MTPTLHFRGPHARTAHLLVVGEAHRTRCGDYAGVGARFAASDLPSGERTFTVCAACKAAPSPAGPCNNGVDSICVDCGTPTWCGYPHGAGHDHARAARACTRRALAASS